MSRFLPQNLSSPSSLSCFFGVPFVFHQPGIFYYIFLPGSEFQPRFGGFLSDPSLGFSLRRFGAPGRRPNDLRSAPLEVSLPRYDGPEGRFCPAKVYERRGIRGFFSGGKSGGRLEQMGFATRAVWVGSCGFWGGEFSFVFVFCRG